jgi:hypothetical protein
MTREKLIEVMRAGAIAAGKGEPSWADCITDEEWEGALLAIESAGAVVETQPSDIRKEAAFLVARLRDFDNGDTMTEDGEREFHGHVLPSLSRLSNLLAKEPGNG